MSAPGIGRAPRWRPGSRQQRCPSVGPMKIRIGFGLGTRSFTNDHATFDPFVDALEDKGNRENPA